MPDFIQRINSPAKGITKMTLKLRIFIYYCIFSLSFFEHYLTNRGYSGWEILTYVIGFIVPFLFHFISKYADNSLKMGMRLMIVDCMWSGIGVGMLNYSPLASLLLLAVATSNYVSFKGIWHFWKSILPFATGVFIAYFIFKYRPNQAEPIEIKWGLYLIIFLYFVQSSHTVFDVLKKYGLARAKINEKTRQVADSINYAKRLQDAILPSMKEVHQHFPNSFILFEPKDIVSGDFYWFEKVNNIVFLAAADCTGHGVPGAMVSVVCASALNRSVKEFDLIDPSQILDKTREIVVDTFAKSQEDVKDGMDISLLTVDLNSNKINWAGAISPIYILRKESNELEIVKGDREPIGYTKQSSSFTSHSLDLAHGDLIYQFSDGFADQFGGPRNKKYGYKRMRNLLLEIRSKPMDEQKSTLLTTIHQWMKEGGDEQVDDICFIGVRIS